MRNAIHVVTPDRFIIVVGTPFNGLVPYGPFKTRAAAEAWGDQRYPVDEWHIVPLEEPEAEAVKEAG